MLCLTFLRPGFFWKRVPESELLAGVVFADEAAALEARMNGGVVESSTNPVSPERMSDDPPALNEAESLSAD
jgi:hypothetical protein